MGGLGQELSSAGAVLGAWAVDAGSGTFFLSPFLLAGPVRVTGWLGSLSVLRIYIRLWTAEGRRLRISAGFMAATQLSKSGL